MTDKVRRFGVDDPNQYWRERAAAGRITEKRLHRHIVSVIRSVIPQGGNVLDCGVGDGHVFRLCREHYRTYGVEFSREAIDRYEFPTENIAQADLNQGIPDFGVKFDVIVISMVLHWLDNPEGFLTNAARSLTPDGRLIAVIPNITHYRSRLAFLAGRFPNISLSHKNFMTPAECESMFRTAGYRILSITTPKPGVPASLWPRLFGRDILYLLTPPCR